MEELELTPEEEKEVKPDPVKEDYVLRNEYRFKPYMDHFVMLEDCNRIMVFRKLRYNVKEDMLQIIYQYTDDSSSYHLRAYNCSFGISKPLSSQAIDAWIDRHITFLQKSRLKFIELHQQFKDLNVSLELSHKGSIL